MDSVNENFKSFDDQASELPEGFGWEDMSAGIYEKMEAPQRKRYPFFWWLSGIGLLLLVASVGYFVFPSDSPEQRTPLIENKTTGETAVPVAATSSSASLTRDEFPVSDDVVASANPQDAPQNETSPTGQSLAQRTPVDPAKIGNVVTQPLGSAAAGSTKATNNQSGAPLPTVLRSQDVAENTSTSKPPTPPNVRAFLSEDFEQVASPNSASNFPVRTEATVVDSLALSFSTPQEFQPSTLGEIAWLTIQPIASQPTELPLLPAFPEPAPLPSTPKQESRLLLAATIGTALQNQTNINTPHLSAWYGTGVNVGYQRQLSPSFSISAQYSLQEIKEEFAFVARDTFFGTNEVPQTVVAIDPMDNLLLTTWEASSLEQFDRQQNILNYNRYTVQQLLVMGHWHQRLGNVHELELGVGLGAQHWISARGTRLSAPFTTEQLDNSSLVPSFSLMGQVQATHSLQLSPKLSLRTGLDYTHILDAHLSGVVRARIGIGVTL